MFTTIFRQEFAHWLRQPLPYIFSIFLFVLSFLTMWGMAAERSAGPNSEMLNSYYRINMMSNYFSLLCLLILPAIIGGAIHRDYKSRMYTLLYAYPIQKRDYLLAKFTSSLVIMAIVSGMIGLGFALATQMPGIEPGILLPFDLGAYVQLYGVYILPNLFLFGTLTFAVVVWTRNVYVAFIAVLLLIVGNGIVSGLLQGMHLKDVAAVFDPVGDAAMKYVVQYWTLEERNVQSLPVHGVILWNRLLWLSVALVIAWLIYQRFEFNQFVSAGNSKKRSLEEESFVFQKIRKLDLPKVDYNYSFFQNLKNTWHLSTVDFRYVVFSWPFLAILFAGFVMVYFQQAQMNPKHGVELLPTTARMLRIPLFIFTLVINFLTFLYMGVLVYRKKLFRMEALIDVVPQPNWVLAMSQLLAIIKVQFLLLTLVMIGGILTQTIHGYFRFELWHYIFELYGLQLIHFAIWAALALFVHTLFRNMYLSLFLLLLCPMGATMVTQIGDLLDLEWLKAGVFVFNQVPGVIVGFDYSDLYGYSSIVRVYGIYKLYWSVLALILILLSVLFWKRGHQYTWRERWQKVKGGMNRPMNGLLTISFLMFFLLGANIYYQERYVSKTFFTEADQDRVLALNEIRYSQFENTKQPKIVKAKIKMDLYPESRDFQASGTLYFVNKVEQIIDTILVAKSFKEKTEFELLNPHEFIVDDEEVRFSVIKLKKGLAQGDTLALSFTAQNHPNSWLHDNSKVLTNGTFIHANILPSLGFRSMFLSGKKKRAKYGLADRKTREYLPQDSSLLGYAFTGNNMDRIEYECILSTTAEQTAFSMGELQREWVEDDRHYFHYKSNGNISNTISWMSGAYHSRYDSIPGLQLEMHHHPDHHHNVEDIFGGSKASLTYCTKWFGALKHKTLKVVEFPITEGTYATLNGNLIPYSESQLLCDVDHHKNDVFNPPYYSSAHEVAHYWWGHRVDPANVQGGKLLTESIAEYIAFMVMEKQFGKKTLSDLRTKYRHAYLRIRAQAGNELPLAQAKLDQDYINYQKGAMAFYALSQYWGEENLNKMLAKYEQDKRFSPPPYPTSLDFLDSLAQTVPDTFQYLLKDWFETITLHDIQMEEVQIDTVAKDKYQVDLDFSFTKYRADTKGKPMYSDNSQDSLRADELKSLPLKDYLQVGFYQTNRETEAEELMMMKTVKVEEIKNHFSWVLSEKPDRIVLDPEQLLIEVEVLDNIWEE